MIRSQKILFVLTLLAAFGWGNLSTHAKVSGGEQVTCGPAVRHPSFATVEDFVEAVQSRTPPWDDLLTPPVDSRVDSLEDFHAELTDHVKVFYRARNFAIVFADNKPGRVSPFCAVIFLLEKRGKHFHVADLIRRSTEYGSYSDVSEPQRIRLRPGGLCHFYFTEFLGGRKWGFDSDEFYIVSGGRFHRTLALRNIGAYLSPADPYREFMQDVQLGVLHGCPRIAIHRVWATDAKENQEQTMVAICSWDPQSRKFISSKARAFSLKVPQAWSAKGLPKPPDG